MKKLSPMKWTPALVLFTLLGFAPPVLSGYYPSDCENTPLGLVKNIRQSLRTHDLVLVLSSQYSLGSSGCATARNAFLDGDEDDWTLFKNEFIGLGLSIKAIVLDHEGINDLDVDEVEDDLDIFGDAIKDYIDAPETREAYSVRGASENANFEELILDPKRVRFALLTGKNSGTTAGVAYEPGSFFWANIKVHGLDNYVFGHEIGHTFGLSHNNELKKCEGWFGFMFMAHGDTPKFRRGCNRYRDKHRRDIKKWFRNAYRDGAKNYTNVNNQTVNWGDPVYLAKTAANDYTDNCGWYGCRVAKEDNKYLALKHGGGFPTQFRFRPDPDTGPANACVQFHDRVVLARTAESYKTGNCGWYGCRVAFIDQDENRRIRFGHGGDSPQRFYLRPAAGEYHTGCVKTGHRIVLARTSEDYQTGNCGWYGCRVLNQEKDASTIRPTHGGSDPLSFHVRAWEED